MCFYSVKFWLINSTQTAPHEGIDLAIVCISEMVYCLNFYDLTFEYLLAEFVIILFRKFITNCHNGLLQIAKAHFTISCDGYVIQILPIRFSTNCDDSNYKLRQLLQIATV